MKSRIGRGCGALLGYAWPVVALAKVTVAPEVVVETTRGMEDKAEPSVFSEALPGAVQVIDREQIEAQSVRHYLDVFRKEPGMLTSHYGQGDIADGFGMRGFESGHGSEIAIFVDGMPINTPNHSHAHGFADVGWLIPEMIERVEIIKGPVSALYGNFALGGVINIITKKTGDTSVGAELGSHGAKRVAGTYSGTHDRFTPFLIGEWYDKEGYRDNGDYQRYNLFGKVTTQLGDGLLSTRVQAVDREWGAPGYLRVSDVQSGLRERTDAVSESDGGDSRYMNVVLNFAPKNGEAGLHWTAYVASEDLNRYATFTGPQRLDHNERVFGGWNVLYNLRSSDRWSLVVGTDGRYDDGDRERFQTVDRSRSATLADWGVKELAAALFVQAQAKVTDQVKLTGGARYDTFDTEVDNRVNEANSGDASFNVFSPKFGAVFSPNANWRFFANYAEGFRTPEVAEMSPASGDANFDLDAPQIRSKDIGFNARLTSQLDFNVDYYWSTTEDEIRFVGADTVNVGETKRDGYELEFKYYPTNALSLFLNYAGVNARIANPETPGADEVAGVADNYMSVGGTWSRPVARGNLIVDAYAQRLGEAPLNADGSIVRDEVTRYVVKASYGVQKWSAFGEITYHPDENVSEGMFDIGGAVYDPKPKLDINAGIKYRF